MQPVSGMSLSDFVRAHIVKASELERVNDLRDARGPSTKINPDPYSTKPLLVDPSPEYLEREALVKDIKERVIETLIRGDWVVSGRFNLQRKDLEMEDLVPLALKWERNEIGPYRNVRVRAAEPSTNREILMNVIERLCELVVDPSPNVKKETIEGFCISIFPKNHTSPDFEVAWKEAMIHPKWRKRGPRSRNS